MAFSYAPPLVIEAAVRHGVFDALDSGPKTVGELSEATGTSPRGLRAILNLLVGVDLLRRHADRYGLTGESAAFLVSSKPSFQGGIYRHLSRHFLPAWLELHEIVRTGRPSRAINEQGFGAGFFEQFVEDIMPLNFAAARALADAVADQLRAPAAGGQVKVLDIASGSGVWGIALAQKSPAVQVTAVDWPAVTPVTRRIAARHGVGERFHIVEGDLLTADFGDGHRVATLGHILHSEGERRSRKLLEKVFGALAPGGTIAIAEFLPNDDRTAPTTPLIFAVNMLVNTDDGDAFTFPEIKGWLTDAGFENPRLVDAPAVSPLILANKTRVG
jgi:SAM-dependent methyltransferase